MRRFMVLTAVALASAVLVSSSAQAQYIVQASPPVVYVQPAPVYYQPTYVVPQARYSYYPSVPVTTYAAPQSVTYAAPVATYAAPIVTYAAPAGVVTTRSYYGYGIFRPRGYYTESYYTPLR